MNKNSEDSNTPVQIELSPIFRSELSADFITRVKEYKYKLREVEKSPLIETLEDFMRDSNAEAELRIWENIANSYDALVNYNQLWNLTQKEKAFAELLKSTFSFK